MVFLKLLLSSGLTFLVATAFFTDIQNVERNKQYLDKVQYLHNITAEHYSIQLTPHIEQNVFYGESNISIRIPQTIRNISLYSKIKCISAMMINNPPRFRAYAREEMIIYKPIKYVHNRTMEINSLHFMNDISPGRYILNIKFFGIIADNVTLTNFDKKEYKWWLVPMHFDILGARRVFPCFGEFFYATFDITIKHHRNYTALSNMLIRKVEINNEDMTLTHFETTPILPTFLVAGIVTNFNHSSSKHMFIDLWYRKPSELRLVFAKTVIENVTLYLESEWKRLRVIFKVDHLAIPDFQDNGMVNLGFILYRETDIIYDENSDSIARKFEVASVIGYKVMKEWFYNIFEELWSSSFWFVDGLLRFFGTYTVHKVVPESRMMDLFVVQFQHEFLDVDTSYNTSQIVSSFEIPRYVKVCIILRMFQHVLSGRIFWNGVRSFINYQKLTVYNFGQAMDRFIKESDLGPIKIFTQELFTMMHGIDSWTNQKYYPTIKIMRDYDHPAHEITVIIQNYNASRDNHYSIPLTFTTQTYLNFDDTLCRYWGLNKRESIMVKLDYKENGWVIFNKQQIGYYRVNYDYKNWLKISHYLNYENHTKIHVLNRAQIIDDAFHFVITNQLNSSIFWNITKYLVKENDYVAWYPMFKALEYMSSIFPFTNRIVGNIKMRIRFILYKLLLEIGFKEIPNEDDLRKCLRQEAAKWSCVLGGRKCKEVANRELERHLANPKKHKLLPWWKEWTYCQGLMLAEFDAETIKPTLKTSSYFTWSTIYDLGLNKSEAKFLEFLTCTDDPDIIVEYLILSEDTWDDYGVHPHYFLFIIAKHASKDKVFKYILNNFEDIKPSQISTAVTLTVLINHLYSKDQLMEVHNYLTFELQKAKELAVKKHVESSKKSLFIRIENDWNIMNNITKMEQEYQVYRTKVDKRHYQIDQQIKFLNKLKLNLSFE